ncbi:response regulator [candidate division GN15 bacterium]|nr:response regulator [candidate division GN15 bacterium]
MQTQPVMLVEDNDFDRGLTCFVFDQEHVLNDVVLSRNGEEAVDYLFGDGDSAESGLLPALVILDLNMPGIGGIDVLKRIRADQRTSRVPVVVFTSSDDAGDRAASFAEGATDFIIKSGSHRKFADAVRKMVAEWLTVNCSKSKRGDDAD